MQQRMNILYRNKKYITYTMLYIKRKKYFMKINDFLRQKQLNYKKWFSEEGCDFVKNIN